MSVTKRIRTSEGKKRAVYRAQVYVSGVRVGDKTFETKAAAYAWHEEESKRRQLGLKEETDIDMSFAECLAKFKSERMAKMEVSTQQARAVRMVYLEGSPLSGLRMVQLNGRAIDRWIEWLLTLPTAKQDKRTSFHAELKLLTTVLNWYRNYLNSGFNVPVTKRHRELVFYKKIKPRRPDYYARPEEVRAWISWLKDNKKPVYYRLASFMVLTGARVGEAAGLMWDQVDLELRIAKVVRIVSWDQNTRLPRLEERTKTEGSNRILMLPPILVELLKEAKANGDDAGGMVFCLKGSLLNYRCIQAAFNAGFEALGLLWRSTHICRHTFATLAMIATRDIGSVQASLGHKSQAMTERYAKTVAMLHSGTADKTAELINLNR